LPPDRLFLGAVPDWVGAEGVPASILIESWLRSLVFRGHRLVVSGPAALTSAPGGPAGLVSALAGGSASLVIQPAAVDRVGAVAADLGAAAAASRAIRAALGDGALHGDAADVADRTLRAASAALEQLAAEGWESLLGPRGQGAGHGRGSGDGRGPERLGGAVVVERADGPTSGARLLQVLG